MQKSLKGRALQYETPNLTKLVAHWGRVMGWGLAQLRKMKLSMRKRHFDQFGRPLEVGTWPSEEYEIVNEEEFTLMDLAAPWGRAGGDSPNIRAGKCQ